MWATLLAGLFARPWARRVVALALAALTITLFILNLRRTAERVGRASERLDQLERTNAIHRQMLDAAANRPRSRDDLLGRLRGGDYPCPPVVAYSPTEQLRVAEEVAALPQGAELGEWLVDYAVLRAQLKACA